MALALPHAMTRAPSIPRMTRLAWLLAAVMTISVGVPLAAGTWLRLFG